MNKMKYDKIVDFKETLSSAVPIVENIDAKVSRDTTKTKAGCACCGQERVVKTYGTVHGPKPLCAKCAKPIVLELRNFGSPVSKLNLIEMFQNLNHPRVYQVSVESEAFRGFDKLWFVEFRKKFNMELTRKTATVAPWVPPTL